MCKTIRMILIELRMFSYNCAYTIMSDIPYSDWAFCQPKKTGGPKMPSPLLTWLFQVR